ncbi:MAG: 2-oxo acid dehydrogenase subunit E2, partial [Candidatus Contendobacter sp.]|nr:2-oxo acid dehydrogenase subunit E2 [Candidatus Contendobacter sp.]
MTVEVKVPTLPESVADGTLVNWKKKPGEAVKRGENLVDLETDKVVLDIPAPADGVLGQILRQEGDIVTTGEVIATLEEGAVAGAAAPAPAPAPAVAAPAPAPAAPTPVGAVTEVDLEGLSPAVRRLAAEHGLDVSKVAASGRGGRVTKADVLAYLDALKSGAPVPAAPAAAPAPAAALAPAPAAAPAAPLAPDARGRVEQRVPMTRLRARIAERLLMAKNTTAMLTTFNEINMKPVMDLRARYKDVFEKKHGVRLGFMGFFVKAVVEALKQFP